MKTEEAWAADIRGTRHIGDFWEWKSHDKYREAFGGFMRDLRAGDKGESKEARGGERQRRDGDVKSPLRKTKARWRRKVAATWANSRRRRRVVGVFEDDEADLD